MNVTVGSPVFAAGEGRQERASRRNQREHPQSGELLLRYGRLLRFRGQEGLNRQEGAEDGETVQLQAQQGQLVFQCAPHGLDAYQPQQVLHRFRRPARPHDEQHRLGKKDDRNREAGGSTSFVLHPL